MFLFSIFCIHFIHDVCTIEELVLVWVLFIVACLNDFEADWDLHANFCNFLHVPRELGLESFVIMYNYAGYIHLNRLDWISALHT